jgi:hypothetical protein
MLCGHIVICYFGDYQIINWTSWIFRLQSPWAWHYVVCTSVLEESVASIFRIDWHFMLENFVSTFQLSLKPDNKYRHFAWMLMRISGCNLLSIYWHEKCFLQIFKEVMKVAVYFQCCFATSVWHYKMKWVHEPEFQFYVFPFLCDVMPCSPVNRFLLFPGACLHNYPVSHPRSLQILIFTTVTTSDLLHTNICT